MVFESSGMEEAVVDVGLEVSKYEGDVAAVVEESVGLSEPVRPYREIE